jgi:FkbM family methyltransferase
MVVSVVVPCKNDARYLTTNLESILSQDYPCLECIVVDGGSTDATVDLLKRHGDRIRWISEPDTGAFDAINRGWQLAKGDILTWLNADDVWEPGAVRSVVEAFEQQPDIDVVYGTAGVVDELGRVHGNLVPRDWDLEHALLNCDHIIFQPASFIRRRMLEEVGWLYPAWCHDHDLWLRIARAGGTFAKIPARLAMDRWRQDNQGLVARIVIPAKIGLTKRFFAQAGPSHLKRLRRRAMSSAYVRCLDYLRGDQAGHWVWAVGLLTRAVLADPRNLGAITRRARGLVRGRGAASIARIRKRLATLCRTFVRLVPVLFRLSERQLGRTVARVFTMVKRLTGRMVEVVFTRGNRRLARKIERVEARQADIVKTLKGFRRREEKEIRSAERAIRSALRPVSNHVDSLAATLHQLADGIEDDRRWVRSALNSLRHEPGSGGLDQALLKALLPLSARLESVGTAIHNVAAGIEGDSHFVRSALDAFRHEYAARADALEQAIPNALTPVTARVEAIAADILKLDASFAGTEPAMSKALQPLADEIRAMAAELPPLKRRIEDNHDSIRDGVHAMRQQHEALGRMTAALERPALVLSEPGDVYGTPPTLQPIPGWRWAWGLDSDIDPFSEGRRRLWDSLDHPVLLRWFADLRVMIWPGNESSRTLFLTGTFEPNELVWVSQVLAKGMTFIDVGANMGVYSMFASRLVGNSGTVVALEPSTRDFQRLAFHVGLNNLERVRCFHVAASDDNGQAPLKVATNQHSGHNTFGAFAWPNIELAAEEIVQTRRLDALVSEQRLERVDLVKIDVEGHELRALKGAVETLARFRPRILIEVFNDALRAQGTTAAEILAFLREKGYTLHEFSDATGELGPLTASLEGGSRNLVALPE